MQMPAPYRLADQAAKQLNKAALLAAEKIKENLRLLGFDDLNVMQDIDSLYEELGKNNRKKFKELWRARCREVLRWMDEDEIDELLEMHLAGLLDEPNSVTHYAYTTEVLRKRDRAKEAALSVPTKAQKQIEIDKHLRYWLQMTGWYLDFVSQDAEISAFEAAGIKKVQRHERDDEKTCSVCREADGQVYEVTKIPPLPHLRCRRWFTPV